MKMDSIDVVKRLKSSVGQISNQSVREFLAEFAGTFILVCFGNGSVAQSILTANKTNNFFSIIWGYSIGVLMGVLVSGGVSGGHINPAVTLAMALWGRLPWQKVPVYMVAQYLGAFFASLMLMGIYNDAMAAFETIPSQTTATIFTTFPGSVTNENGTTIQTHLSALNGMTDQIFATMLLLICVCAIGDRKNIGIPSWMGPFFTAFVVLNIGLSFGMNCGFPINPARDLAPRFFTLLAGWGDLAFTATTSDGFAWWWIPILGPHLGAILGMAMYTIFIELHHRDDSESPVKPILPTNGVKECIAMK